jgi:2-dehydropantoate 2-reductase
MAVRTENPRAVIVGAGAVGLALGTCLHYAGWRLSYVVRDGDAPHPLEEHGIRRSGIFGESIVPATAIDVRRSFESLRDEDFHVLLVCTKTTSSTDVARALGAVWYTLAREPLVVLCQNGWGNAERFAAWMPRDRIFNARIITGFRRISAHAVDVTVHADSIHLGSLFGESTDALKPLCEAIAIGGIPCELSADIQADLWAKVLYNCLLNPLGALVGVPYGALGECQETRNMIEEVAREVFEVLARTGHHTHWHSAEAYLETFYRDLLPPTAQHESSMLQDLRAGRPTEIDALCGAVTRLGIAHDVQTPVNEALTRLVHLAERRAPSDP